MVLANPLPLVPYPLRVVAGEGAPLRLSEGSAPHRELVPGGAPESYTISVTAAGAVVRAADNAGLFYADRTLAQLVQHDDSGAFIAPVEIEDAPRFGYRGMMLDIARHFFDAEAIKGVIDRASALKFNHLHLHLSDDQGWRLELTSRPRLTTHAAGTSALGDAGGFLTQADYRDILAYAAARHMTVVPEFDLPGHTHAVGVAYPELVEQPALSAELVAQAEELGQALPVHGEPYTGWAVGHSSLRIQDDATWVFLEEVLGELAALTPGPYLHIGGDECLGTDPDDYADFLARVTALVQRLGKTPVAWHEAGAAEAAPGTVGQFWGLLEPTDAHAAHTRAFAARGGRVILSPADAAYLDMIPEEGYPLGLHWAGIVPLSRAYDWEPTAVIPGLDAADILGVEAALWTETARTPADLDALMFPRVAAIAEIAWSAPAGTPERSWESFAARIAALAPHWAAAGWGGYRSPEIAWDTL